MRHLIIVFGVAVTACGVKEDSTPRADTPQTASVAETSALPSVTDSVVAVTAGEKHMCALTVSGAVYCLGENNGLLGNGTTSESDVLVRVKGDHHFIAVAAAGPVTCGVDRDRRAHCWGEYDGGQLGSGKLVDSSTVPRAVVGGHRFTAISAGVRHICALDEGGAAWCWGHNDYGQLGDGTRTSSGTPVRVALDEKLTAITADQVVTCALTSASQVSCWGGSTPGAVNIPGGAIAVGARCAIAADSSAYCWDKPSQPERVESDARFARIFANNIQRCAITRDGTPYCWGMNRQGWLGVEPDTSCATTGGPVQCNVRPKAMGGAYRFREIALTGNHVIATGLDGRAYWWGIYPVGPDRSRTPRVLALPQ